MRVVPASQLFKGCPPPPSDWYGSGGTTDLPLKWFEDGDHIPKIFVALIASESGSTFKATDTYIILPRLKENLDTPHYCRGRCYTCEVTTPHLYYKYDVEIENWCARIGPHGHLDHPPPSQEMVRKNGKWCYCTITGRMLLHRFHNDPRPHFYNYQCLVCAKDPRVGALTLINPLQGALTYQESGEGLLSILT